MTYQSALRATDVARPRLVCEHCGRAVCPGVARCQRALAEDTRARNREAAERCENPTEGSMVC